MLFTNAAAVIALLPVLTSFVAASPVEARDSVNGVQGYLHVLELTLGNPSPTYNKTASIQRTNLQIANPNYSFTLDVVKPAVRPSSSDTALVRIGGTSCLAAHHVKGPSYFYLDECPDQSAKTGEELTELKARTYFLATRGGDNVNLALKGNSKKGWPSRPNVHVIESSQEVHATTENGAHNKQLYLQIIQ